MITARCRLVWLGVGGRWLPTWLPENPLAWLMFESSNSLSTRASRSPASTRQLTHDRRVAGRELAVGLIRQASARPANAIGPKMAREHHRMLGNGYCTRPPELDCAFEAICETCTFF